MPNGLLFLQKIGRRKVPDKFIKKSDGVSIPCPINFKRFLRSNAVDVAREHRRFAYVFKAQKVHRKPFQSET